MQFRGLERTLMGEKRCAWLSCISCSPTTVSLLVLSVINLRAPAGTCGPCDWGTIASVVHLPLPSSVSSPEGHGFGPSAPRWRGWGWRSVPGPAPRDAAVPTRRGAAWRGRVMLALWLILLPPPSSLPPFLFFFILYSFSPSPPILRFVVTLLPSPSPPPPPAAAAVELMCFLLFFPPLFFFVLLFSSVASSQLCCRSSQLCCRFPRVNLMLVCAVLHMMSVFVRV